MDTQTPNQTRDILEDWIQSSNRQIHTALPASIVSYDAPSNRAAVKPFGNYKTRDYRNIPYPIIYDVPVIFPVGNGGKVGMTFPVNPGDGCLLVFAESQLDDFLTGGDSSDIRDHDMRDAICIPGLYSEQATTSKASQSDVCIYNGGTMIRISDGAINITGARLTIDGDVIAGGVSLGKHTHTGDSGGMTSVPN